MKARRRVYLMLPVAAPLISLRRPLSAPLSQPLSDAILPDKGLDKGVKAWCWLRALGLAVALSAWLAAPAKAGERVTYQDNILPLIQAHCAKCHNEDKKKADLDLTSYQSALKGSGSGVVLLPGNPDGSKLWKAITQTEEPFMPQNQPPLPPKELALFKQWIQGGLLEHAGSKALAARQPQIDFTLKSESVSKPEGPPPMPGILPRAVVVHTAHTTAITGLAASPWAPLVAVAGQKEVLLFQTETLELLGILPFTEGQPVDLKFSRSGQLLLAAGGIGATSGRAVVWDVVTGKKLMTLGDDYDTVLAADIRADQSQVALGGPTRLVKIWSTKTGQLQHRLKKHTDWVTAVAFSPNGQMLASADRNGGVSVWDPDTAQELFALAGHKAAVTALSWRGDSKLLASGSEDGTVKLWEMDEGKPVKSWTAHGAGVLSVSYAHADRLVTCGRDNAVTLWDGNGKKVRDLEKCCDLPLRANFSSDGSLVFGADFEGHVAVWRVKDGKRIGGLDTDPAPDVGRLAAAQHRSG
jgi:WD40 repeat protein